MVGKSYLRYVVGPQGGAVVSSASLTVQSAVAKPQYTSATAPPTSSNWRGGGSQNSGGGYRRAHQQPQHPASVAPSAMLFTPSLEAVRVCSVRSGALVHTLIPKDAKMPMEVTSLRVVPMDATVSAAATGSAPQDPNVLTQRTGWQLLVGYGNGSVAVFSCSPTNNYGRPVCRFLAQGHKVDTNVLALAVDTQRVLACSAGQDTDITVWDLVSHEAAFRLRGHRGGVVGLEFVPGNDEVVISAAADGLVKVWNIGLRQCVQTLVASDSQVTSMAMDSMGSRIYCGMREDYLKVYNTEALRLGAGSSDGASKDTGSGGDSPVVDHGTIQRKYHKPPTSISFSSDGSYLLACTSKTIEVFHVRSAEDVKKKVQRKRKRRRAGDAEKEMRGAKEHAATTAGSAEASRAGGARPTDAATSVESPARATAAEEVTLLRTFFMTQKVRSACFVPPHQSGSRDADQLHIAVTFSNNSVQTFTTELTTSELDGAATLSLEDLRLRHSLDQRGHQSDIRALQFVDTDSALLSMSKEKVMLWGLSLREDLLETNHIDDHDFHDAREANLARADFKGTLNSTASVSLEGVEAVAMAAISSHVCCVGMQDGTVQLLDVPPAEVSFTEPAFHVGGVTHVTRRPDDSGFLTVGADRRLVLWTVGLMEGQQTATLILAQETELTESPLVATFSPDNRFLGVGLQNNNIQLFFAVTLKPYLSLFGHKLPPTSLAFSSDGTLVASVGMDKSLRFWGTDFGDCHRAIHAHDDYVTSVEFVHDTHYVFTASMDGSVKQWDGDTWTMIQMFRQHQRGLWAAAVTKNATCLATAGADKCIRCFLRTQDIVFPQEEEEQMAQEAMDEETARRAAMQKLSERDAADEVGVAGQQTAATAEAAERIMEALDLVSIEQQRKANPEDTSPRHPLLAFHATEWEYLWSVIESVRPSEIRHALASLTSTHVDALLDAMNSLISARAVLNYETASRVVLALVAPAPGQHSSKAIAVSGEVSEVQGARRLETLRRSIAVGLDSSVGRMDYNIAGLQVLRQYLEDTEKVKFFDLSKVQGYKKKYHSRTLS